MPGTLARFTDWPLPDEASTPPAAVSWREITIHGERYRITLEGERIRVKRQRMDEDDAGRWIWERCEPPSDRSILLALLGG